VLPASWVEQGDYEILGSPGLAYGFAAGDRIRLADDGTYEVLRRGGNICLRLFPAQRPSDSAVATLTTAFEQLDGLVEMPADRRFIVVTVPAASGFPAVESAVGEWTAEHGCAWEYGNVYDEADRPLGWWTTD
jgi:hypothetical protein